MIVVWTGAAVADDVPPPPSDLSPKSLFNGTNGATPARPMPSQGGTAPVQPQPAPQYYYYSSAASSGGRTFPFAGFTLGASLPIDGTVDDLFNAGSLFELEIGQQWELDEGPIDAFAISLGYVNQTYFPADGKNVVDTLGRVYGLGNMSVNTFKPGAYVSRSFGDFDFYVGIYGKVGYSLLNEDYEFYTFPHDIISVQKLNTDSFVGGGGLEAAICLAKYERSSLALVGGAEYLYLDHFAWQDHWTLFLNAGVQWEVDITDGFFPQRDRDPRRGRHHRRAARRCRRPF
jgi:hypothetical protein